jgi:pectate lyase
MKTIRFANLFVLLAFTFLSAQDQCKPIGWATRSGRTGGEVSVTGGGNATPITVTTFADLKKYASDNSPRVLYVSGPVGSGWSGTSGDQLVIASNKTIIGLHSQTELKAVIKISGGQNIIVRNLVIHGPGSNSDQAWDNLLIQGDSKNIWIDHCEFWNGQDGNADVVKGADNVTFTWCIFGYTIGGEHNLSNLIASSDNEPVSETKLNATFMFNWFKAASQRTPRCRYGNIHVINNLLTEDLSVHASESGVANGYECNVKTEYNHFIGINEPIKISMQSGSNSIQESTGNIFESTSGNKTGTGTAFTPPYEYKSFMVTADKVKALVQANAGATLTSQRPVLQLPTSQH